MTETGPETGRAGPTKPSYTRKEVIAAAQGFQKQLLDAQSREFNFLLIGRTGVGKSSTINNLMGQDMAAIGEFEPQTMSVEEYTLPVDGIKFCVFDTPGLCDDLPDKGNDKKYLEHIKSKVSYVDSLLYVTQLNDTRVRADERFGIDLVTKALGPRIWKQSVIVFTFADQIRQDRLTHVLSERTRLIRNEIQRLVPGEIASSIPSVEIDNAIPTVDGINKLYMAVAKRISAEGFLQYLLATNPEFVDSVVEPRVVEKVVERRVYVDRPYINHSCHHPTNRLCRKKVNATGYCHQGQC